MTEDDLLKILAKLIVILNGKDVLSEVTDAFNEMLRYKSIEEELGVDLVTLFKALNDGAYIKRNGIIAYAYFSSLGKANEEFRLEYNPDGYGAIKVKDYGKTWALTKEELTKEELTKEELK